MWISTRTVRNKLQLIYTSLDINGHEERKSMRGTRMRRERGIGFCIQRGATPRLVPVGIKSFYGATLAHLFWHTNSHVFSG